MTTTNELSDRAQIVKGSKTQFTLYLVDEFNRPISLTPYSAGNLVFCNQAGLRTVVPLTIPGSNPDAGAISVVLTAVQTANADKKWKDADIELTEGADTIVRPINDKFEILIRNCPP